MDNTSRLLLCVLLLANYGKSTPADFSRFGENTDSCSNLQFKCDDGKCIPQENLCDGHADCADKSDETKKACKSMRCSQYVFRCEYGACVDGDSICNGIKDCVDNSDETLPSCSKNSSLSAECSSNQFKCNSGQCIDSTSLCDGIVDCGDQSDETSIACGSFPCDAYVFRCAYGACIDMDLRCNGVVNCADASDEAPTLCAKGTTQRPSITRPTVYRPNTPRTTVYQPVTPRPTPRPSTEVTCPVPPQPPNGQYKLYKSHCPNRQHCNVDPRVRSLEKGTQLIYSCHSGFKMNGIQDVLCGPEGKWLHVPKCIEIRCDGLSSASREAYCIHNNRHVPCEESVPPFTSADLRCRNSYHQEENPYSLPTRKDRVICNETGHWSPDPIRCVAGPSTINIYVEGDLVAIQSVQLNLSHNNRELDPDRILFIDNPDEKFYTINMRDFCGKRTKT